jgi:glucosyl-dolichyl phosphate glucuronosyltransferase
VLTGLAGSRDGLGAEGRYVREVLPRAVASDLKAAMRGKVGAARRAGAIVAGFALTAFAYATTRLGGTAEALSQHLLSRVRVWRA